MLAASSQTKKVRVDDVAEAYQAIDATGFVALAMISPAFGFSQRSPKVGNCSEKARI
jgi:hypothetical protein